MNTSPRQSRVRSPKSLSQKQAIPLLTTSYCLLKVPSKPYSIYPDITLHKPHLSFSPIQRNFAVLNDQQGIRGEGKRSQDYVLVHFNEHQNEKSCCDLQPFCGVPEDFDERHVSLSDDET